MSQNRRERGDRLSRHDTVAEYCELLVRREVMPGISNPARWKAHEPFNERWGRTRAGLRVQ